MENEEKCIFCEIGKGTTPRELIYEDEEVSAFLDISPNTHGHTLVIPKDHFENLYTLPPETLCRMMLAVQKLAIAVREATQADGINIAMNNEKGANQLVMHAHIHIIPRHDGEEWVHFPHKSYIGTEMQDIGRKIRESIVD